MKAGVRTIGIAESYDGSLSTLAGVVTRADRVVDGVAFETCTVGGTDATAAVSSLVGTIDREDVEAILVAGIAPAWYNIVDLNALSADLEHPLVSVSFEASPGLESALRREFSGDELERRLETYRRQPPRTRLELPDGELFFRSIGYNRERTAELLRAFTPEGGRPEPLRVARMAARAGDRFRRGGWTATDDSDEETP